MEYPDAPRENDPLGSSLSVEDLGDGQRRFIQVQRVAKRVVFLLIRLSTDAGIWLSLVSYRISSSPSLQPAQQWLAKAGCGRPWTRQQPEQRRPMCLFQKSRSAASLLETAIELRFPQSRAYADVYARILQRSLNGLYSEVTHISWFRNATCLRIGACFVSRICMRADA